MPDPTTHAASRPAELRRDWRPDIRGRLSKLSIAPSREAEIVEELTQHLDDRWHELVAQGKTPDDAARITRTEFSGARLEALLGTLRQAHWTDPALPIGRGFLLAGTLTDVRDSVRALRATPGFTIVALLVLTLGIGATTAIFSVVDAVVLRGLPFDEHDRLVALGERGTLGPGKAPVPIGGPSTDPQALRGVQPQNYLDWIAQQRVFESVAALWDASPTLRMPGDQPEELVAQRVTASFFDVLRVRPAIGRAFTVENEVDGRHRVAVLSNAFWQRRFAANPEIVGRTIPLDDGPYEVMGIMAAGTTYPVGALRPTDVWIPYVVPESQRIRGRGYSAYLQVIARLKPDVSVAQAQAQMEQVASAIEQANPATTRGNTVGVRPLHDHLVGASTRSWMLMLLGAVGLVLLIACTNVANLLLARASTREREVSVRAALGASRWRLVRLLLAESLVLSLAGTALSIALAWWMVGVLRSALPEGVPRVANIAVDLRVLVTAAGLSLITGLLAGIVPALQLSKPDLTYSLKENTRAASAGRGRQRLRAVLVVAEVALAVVLLVGAALFIGSFMALMRIDPGFRPNRVITTYISPPSEPGQRPPDRTAAFLQILERVQHVPGVVSAAVSVGGVPLGRRARINGLRVKGREDEGQVPVWIKPVTPDYHVTLGIPIRGGRPFNTSDSAGGPGVVLLSESTTRALFPGEDSVGRTILMDAAERRVVGVVGDVRHSGLETGPRTEVYIPWAQTQSAYGELVIRTSEDPNDVLPAVRSAVLAVLPDVPLREVTTMDEVLSHETAPRRLNMLMLGLFGLLGLVISAAGIYGVMAFVVSQRTREIGIRMALGATRSSVMGMVLINAGVLLTAGLVAGCASAWFLRTTAKAFLFGVDATDPRAFGAAIGALSLAALIASIIPARRAASVDPIVALRAE